MSIQEMAKILRRLNPEVGFHVIEVKLTNKSEVKEKVIVAEGCPYIGDLKLPKNTHWKLDNITAKKNDIIGVKGSSFCVMTTHERISRI